MKAKNITLILFIIIFVSFSGCKSIMAQSSEIDKTTPKNYNELESDNNMNNTTNTAVSNNIAIYQINRDKFNMFLEANTFNYLKTNASKCYVYPTNGNDYITSATTLFKVRSDFINFVSDYNSIQNYLAQNGKTCVVENIAVFDTPHIPLSIWIQTKSEYFFMTINENYNDIGYIYRLYSKYDYCKKYGVKDFRLTVNDHDITNDKPVLMYFDYADLPITRVLSALGAKISKTNNTQFTISFKGKTYFLNAKNNSFYKEGNINDNYFDMIDGGGPYYMYLLDEEFYTDSNLFKFVLEQMGEKVDIQLDTSGGAISIVSKQ